MGKQKLILAFVIITMSLMAIPNYQNIYAVDAIYNVNRDTDTVISGNALNIKFVGENVTETSSLLGATITSVQLFLSCNHVTLANCSAFTQSATVGVWDTSIGTVTVGNAKRVIGTIAVNTLTETTQLKVFVLSSSYTFVANDAIGIIFTEDLSGNSNNVLEVGTSLDNEFNGTSTHKVTFSNIDVWSSQTGEDLSGVFIGTLSGQEGDFCDLPENANILVCRLGGTGAFGSAGDFVIGTAPTNTTDGTGLTGIGCGIGLVDCIADPDIKTNGLGLLIFVASIFVVVGMFVVTQGLGNTINLPVYMWAIIIIALSAFFTITNVIDPVFLIISIIGLIALASPKIVNIFKGGNTMGEGSTE